MRSSVAKYIRSLGRGLVLGPACLWATVAPAATVTTDGGSLVYADASSVYGSVTILMAPCMANELFTFKRVSLDGTPVNITDSDNIGPFGLADGGGWSGGNHTNPGPDGTPIRSARTVAVNAFVDGRPLKLELPTCQACSVLTVEVVNELLMPGTELPFATETMCYTISGNSVDVVAQHRFTCAKPVKIDRYYGMQSMFIGETEILTPGGLYNTWTPIAEVNRFSRASAPGFCLFVEHSPAGYQAAWLDPAPGTLGDRTLVRPDDWVYIGNSYTKAYHKTIGSHTVQPGDTLRWHGIYSWFRQPLADGASPGSPHPYFAYPAYEDGHPVLVYASEDGTVTISPLTKE